MPLTFICIIVLFLVAPELVTAQREGAGRRSLASRWDVEDTPPEAIWGLALGAGAVGGTLVGIAIGSGVHVYRRRYP
jgi:hypothetical protein